MQCFLKNSKCENFSFNILLSKKLVYIIFNNFQELDSVKDQLEQITEARRRQEALVENIVVQRDMYKTMVESQGKIL